MIDPVEFGKQMAAIVREATTPLLERIDALERQLADVPAEIDVEAIAKEVAAHIPAPRDGVDGKDADMDALMARVDEMAKSIPRLVSEAVKEIPAPRDGVDGKDADMAELKLHVHELVKNIQLPAPPSVDEVAAAFERRFSDLTLSWERQARETFEKAADRMPVPKDGRDALPLDSFDMELAEDGRTLTLKMHAGDTVAEKSLRIATVLDRGPYRREETYEKGDAVTHGGSLWIAQVDDPEGAPGLGGKGWRLAVKKGRDGKDLRDNASSADTSKGVSVK